MNEFPVHTVYRLAICENQSTAIKLECELLHTHHCSESTFTYNNGSRDDVLNIPVGTQRREHHFFRRRHVRGPYRITPKIPSIGKGESYAKWSVKLMRLLIY